MAFIVKRLILGVGLIALCSVILLLSDLPRKGRDFRKFGASPKNEALPKIAILKFSSRQVLDDTVAGVLDALGKKGFHDNGNIQIRQFNPENDLPTANSMAKSIVDGGYRMVITASTPMLQVMAAANKEGKVVHVFGAVTDPFVSGVGISRENSFDRPKHLVGVGTFQPVKELFRLAKKCRPELRKVGVVWCTSETCSEACVRLAREVCKDELGIELLEATVDNSNQVLEAAGSLVARGAEALWIGGDNIVESAVSSVVKAAADGRIPVIANAPNHAEKGVLIAMGSDYFEVGNSVGSIAADILSGESPMSFPVKNYAPEKLALNLDVPDKLNPKWSIPSDVIASAAIIVKDGRTDAAAAKLAPGAKRNPRTVISEGKHLKMFFANYNETSHVEETLEGFTDEMGKLGFRQGADFDVRITNAQGDMPALLATMDTVKELKPDFLLLTSTPALQAALSKGIACNVVFGSVADPVLAGAGKSPEEHLPNITGISTMSDFEGMIGLIKKYFPAAKKIGTLYAPGEINSVLYKEKLEAVARAAGISVEAVAVSAPIETADAAAALIGKRIDILCQISDNLTDAGFSGIVQAGRAAKVPVFSFIGTKVESGGAAVAVARDYVQVGRDMAALVRRIVNGEKVSEIPFRNASKTETVVNVSNAESFGLRLPDDLVNSADRKY